jgi:hypothetical protein
LREAQHLDHAARYTKPDPTGREGVSSGSRNRPAP